ncbi:MAG: DUF481 domain-containing protein [Bryobacterales bacterium]|nr:DUF481 domain-containing protein [Bryobacterales bacterium]
MHLPRTLFGLLLALAGQAALPADIVTLANGDRLTGVVRRVSDGKLTLQSDLAGTVQIEWSDIRELQTEADFSVLTAHGQRLDGRLTLDGARVVVSQQSREPVSVPSAEVARVVRGTPRRGARKVISALDGSADIGYSVARGNQNQMQSSTGIRAGYTSAQYQFSGRISSLFARQDGARSQSRHALNARLDRFLNDRSFAYALTGLERNERRLLDLRSRLGGGMGWRVRSTGNTTLSLLGGAAYVHERLRDQANQSTFESFGGVEWSTLLLGVVSVDTQLTIHPNLLDGSDVRVEYDGTFRVPIAGRFTYSLRLFDRYDTRPAAMVARNDYGVVTGLGVVF